MRALYSLEWRDDSGWYLFQVYTSLRQAKATASRWHGEPYRIRKWVRA